MKIFKGKNPKFWWRVSKYCILHTHYSIDVKIEDAYSKLFPCHNTTI